MQELLDSVRSLSVKERKALAALLKRQGVNLYGVTPILKRGAEEQLVLSYAQQRQWFIWQLEPQSTAYNMPTALRLKGALDIEALRASFERLIARHETLRTTFAQNGEQVIQCIHPALAFPLVAEVVSVGPGHELGGAIKTQVETEMKRPFDLEHGPLLRVKLLRLAPDDHVLVLTMHHIVSDGWSMPVMVDELVRLYEGYSQGRDVELPELPIQYADYAIWQRNWMDAGERERQLNYWKAQLGDEQPVLELPTDRPRPAVQSHAGASLNVELSDELSQSLKRLAQEQGVTLFMLLLASFQTLLHRYSGQDDIRVGVPIANRTRVETEGLIGFFVNTQVLRAEFDLQVTFGELLQQVKQAALGAQAHQDLPFEQLVEALQPERSLSHSPLFQVMFNHQMAVKGESRYLSGLMVEGLSWDSQTAQFDLSLDTFEDEAGLSASLNYATALFDRQSIERLARHWRTLLEDVVRRPGARVAELALLGTEEQRQIVRGWNRTQVSYPSDWCIHRLIEAQVEQRPEATALVFGEHSLSYRELNQRANRLAHRLRELGVGPDVLVGIAVERSLEMVVGLLGILKAGGAYVPLDPEYPQERLAYMIEDSGIGLLLTQSHLHGQLPLPEDIRSLDLEGGGNWLEGYGEANLESDSHPENLAYVIYTSGSTGKPKGALLPHHNVIRLFRATQDWFHFDSNDVWSIFHSYAFDFSVWELFGALLHGAKAIIVPRETARSPEDFHALLVRERVTILNQTPSAFKQLIPIASAGAKTKSALALRYVVFGGEALDVGSLQGWFECFGDQRPFLVNMYGITETTVHVTYRPLSRADLQQSAISPIGEVITDLSWYLLDSNLNLVAPGCHGELYVGRAGLARGYHRRTALTAERFVPNPFDDSERGGGRLYRTGDLACCRADGVIDYIGRIDHQMKIRGFRVELGEIEAKLQEHPAVREAVVIDVEAASGKQLAAYLVLASTPEAAESEERRALRGILHDHLTSLLPDYMVPSYLVFIDGLPLTANGKLDRKALPKPEGGQLQQAYVAPGSELQQRIAAIWADLLKVERVGLNDNFFELGGHSLLLLTVKERIRQTCGETLGINQLMLNPTVRSLAAYLEGGRRCSVLVKLNGQENGVPLFLFHPSFGSVHCYKPLAMALRNERPVWGIVCRALVEIGAAVPSWQEMVDDYVEQILGVQSVGPYYLAGWSSGGNLAMDVAFELERSGRRVEFLGWIDAPPPLRITSFWQEVGIPRADSHHAGSFDDGQRDLLCIMFPEFAERINEAWSKLQNTPKSDDERMAEFSIWAQESLGSDFRRLCQELLEGGEYQVSWELKRTLDIRLQDTDYKRVTVPPTCWWAAQSKTERIRDIIESSMRQGVGQQVESTIIDTTHVEIIKNPDFIRSFVSVLSQCYSKGS